MRKEKTISKSGLACAGVMRPG
uniref:Uncharacterized protein n=1 Tax=Arundo donax TaxID=35708 RepID=A0A0A9C340_ARUDO